MPLFLNNEEQQQAITPKEVIDALEMEFANCRAAMRYAALASTT